MTPETEDLIRAAIGADVIRGATAIYWGRRAEEFEAAKPRIGDFHGRATHEELTAAWQRCHWIAEACRRKALTAEIGGESREAKTRAA